jgi:hypothetical protein
MAPRITVHPLDPADRTVLATIHPDGSVTGTADPALRRAIQEALADPIGDYDPRLRAFVPGPASRYDGHSLEWVACIQGALLARGLCGRALGYRRRLSAGHAPGPTPRG